MLFFVSLCTYLALYSFINAIETYRNRYWDNFATLNVDFVSINAIIKTQLLLLCHYWSAVNSFINRIRVITGIHLLNVPTFGFFWACMVSASNHFFCSGLYLTVPFTTLPVQPFFFLFFVLLQCVWKLSKNVILLKIGPKSNCNN